MACVVLFRPVVLHPACTFSPALSSAPLPALFPALFPVESLDMPMPLPFRILISAPADMADEGRRAAIVIHRLGKAFTPFFKVSTLLWEDRLTPASAASQ